MRNLRVDGDRLWASLMEMGRIGETPAGGCRRLALTEEEGWARDLFCRWAKEAGCTVTIDRIGNIFARRPGTDEQAAPVMIGSHLDTVPTGGKFDGPFGVLAGLEVVRSMNDAGLQTRAPVEVTVWTNEEGSRFSPMTLGSSVFTGEATLEFALGRTDPSGVTVDGALKSIGYAGPEPVGGRAVAAYFEAHIEQGPLLAQGRETIGIVTGSFSARYYVATVTGEAAHVGPTPMDRRRDAMVGAALVALAVERIGRSRGPDGRSNAPHIEVFPNVRGVIPAQVKLSCDLRHSDPALLPDMESELRAAVAEIAAERGLQIDLDQYFAFGPIRFDPDMIALLRRTTAALDLPHRDILTVASHDAVPMTGVCPTGMIFVPSPNGLSHNETEYSEPEHVAAGASVLLHALLEKAGVN